MRDLIFEFGTETVAIQINNKDLKFCKVQGGVFKYASIDGLKLSISGILKEFPELRGKDKEEMRKIALKRFKSHVKSLKTENDIQEYLKNDLAGHGYKLRWLRRAGFRKKKVK